jgi:uncharacterized membrane protein YqaE (UPF0057 family)
MTVWLKTSFFHTALVVLYLLCLAGLGLSLWAHVVSFLGIDPRTRFPRIWLVELSLTGILLPLVVVVLRRGINQDPLRLSRLSWKFIIGLTAYYAFHFYLFIARASDELTSDVTWQMFSAGWILLFGVGFAFYRGVLARLIVGEHQTSEQPHQNPAAL